MPDAYLFKPIYLSNNKYVSNHRWRAVVQTKYVCDADWERLFELWFRETESLNYAGNDRTCNHSLLTMLLGNTPLSKKHDAKAMPGTHKCLLWLKPPYFYLTSSAISRYS